MKYGRYVLMFREKMLLLAQGRSISCTGKERDDVVIGRCWTRTELGTEILTVCRDSFLHQQCVI
jgi:hypothetical protein